MDDVYRRIKETRVKKGMSQQELAEAVGYKSGKSMIAKIESGLVDLPMIKVSAIADALGVEPSDLMGWNSGKLDLQLFNDKTTVDYKLDGTYLEISNTVKELNEENRKKILDIAKAYLMTQGKE